MVSPGMGPSGQPITWALVVVGWGLVVAMTVTFTQLAPEYRVWNASVIGALALFSGARLGVGRGLVITAVAIALKDLCLSLTTPWWEPYPLTWLYMSAYVVLGWWLLRPSPSVSRAVVVGFAASVIFFWVSNFVSWLDQALPYGYSGEGLWNCYIAAIPFYRGTLLGDVGFSAVFFGTHAALSAVYHRRERALVPEEVRS